MSHWRSAPTLPPPQSRASLSWLSGAGGLPGVRVGVRAGCQLLGCLLCMSPEPGARQECWGDGEEEVCWRGSRLLGQSRDHFSSGGDFQTFGQQWQLENAQDTRCTGRARLRFQKLFSLGTQQKAKSKTKPANCGLSSRPQGLSQGLQTGGGGSCPGAEPALTGILWLLSEGGAPGVMMVLLSKWPGLPRGSGLIWHCPPPTDLPGNHSTPWLWGWGEQLPAVRSPW